MKRKLSHICTRYKDLILISIFAFSPLAAFAEASTEIISTPETPVIIIDGDSLEIGTTRIRLIGIDAPEYDQFCKKADNTEYPCGQHSTNFLRNLIADSTVTCKIHKKDKYKRNLCTCYANGQDLNREMVLSGLAVTYMESDYQKEEVEAQAQKRGLWQGRFMRPRLFRIIKSYEKSPDQQK